MILLHATILSKCKIFFVIFLATKYLSTVAKSINVPEEKIEKVKNTASILSSKMFEIARYADRIENYKYEINEIPNIVLDYSDHPPSIKTCTEDTQCIDFNDDCDDQEICDMKNGICVCNLKTNIAINRVLAKKKGKNLELKTPFDGTFSAKGNMFNIEALNKIKITGFSAKISSPKNVVIKIYTRKGTYNGFETNQSQWKLISKQRVKNKKINIPKQLQDLKRPININKSKTQAFYVTTSRAVLFSSANVKEGTNVASNTDLKVFSGKVTLGDDFRRVTVVQDFSWNGSIRYKLRKKKTRKPKTPPTNTPSKRLTNSPTQSPTKIPTKSPTRTPTQSPTKNPTKFPTKNPTQSPTKNPTKFPTKNPTQSPTKNPTKFPTKNPTQMPTKFPTKQPTRRPTKIPTNTPTKRPTKSPTKIPTARPTVSIFPSNPPSITPTTSFEPSVKPSILPTYSSKPSFTPSIKPSKSTSPSIQPSIKPIITNKPSKSPTTSLMPSKSSLPSSKSSNKPTRTGKPSNKPSKFPTTSLIPSTMTSNDPTTSLNPSTSPSNAPSISLIPTVTKGGSPPLFNPSTANPSKKPSIVPSISIHPSTSPSLSQSLSLSPSNIPSNSINPSSKPSTSPSVSIYPSNGPSNTLSKSLKPSLKPSVSFRPSVSFNPTSSSSPSISLVPSSPGNNANFMSGNHGIAFRTNGGVNYLTSFFDVSALTIQFTENLQAYGVSWFIINLSTHFRGDRYLANHSILTNLNRGSTPKTITSGDWSSTENLPLESYANRDLFGEFIAGFTSVGVRVIAYLASEGPAMLKTSELNAYDFKNASNYVDSCTLCPTLLPNIPGVGCDCAPSVHQWKNHVKSVYGADDDSTLKQAFAEIIVGEFAQRYKSTDLAGFWFDQADVADIPRVHAAVREHMPSAVLAFNIGRRLPLTNNNPPYEDVTFGFPYHDLTNFPASHCRNFIIIPIQESTPTGVYYDSTTGKGSLGHFFSPILSDWNSGTLVWSAEQASEWMSRFLQAKGGWTWNVRRGSGSARSVIDDDDLAFLKSVYDRLPVSQPFNYQCDYTPSASPSTSASPSASP